MAIKNAVVLACTGGVDYTQFRDLNAVEAFLDDVELRTRTLLSKVTREVRGLPEHAAVFLSSFSHPPAKVNRHLGVLNELFDKVETLESIYAMLVSGFSTMRKAGPIVDRVQALVLHMKARVDKALQSLSAAVVRYQPEYFGHCCQQVLSKVTGGKPVDCEDLNVINMMRVVVHPQTGDTLGTQFTTYLCFKGLVDSKGYSHDRYHVALSCVVDRYGKFTMNYALQPQLLLPGKFRSNDTFSDVNNCLTGIGNRMTEEGFAWRAAA